MTIFRQFLRKIWKQNFVIFSAFILRENSFPTKNKFASFLTLKSENLFSTTQFSSTFIFAEKQDVDFFWIFYTFSSSFEKLSHKNFPTNSSPVKTNNISYPRIFVYKFFIPLKFRSIFLPFCFLLPLFLCHTKRFELIIRVNAIYWLDAYRLSIL